METKSGIIRFEKDEIVFTFGKDELVRFSFHDVIVVGEMTLGPGSRFLVFVAKNGKQYSLPCHHTSNITDFTTQLGERLNIKITAAPSFTDDLDSIVIYPQDIAGRRIYYFITDQPVPGGFRKTDKGIGLQLILREEIRNYKGKAGSQQAVKGNL